MVKTSKLTDLKAKLYQEKLPKGKQTQQDNSVRSIDEYAIGEYVIIRTFSAGVHYGRVEQIKNNKVILRDSKRLHKFICLDDGDSLSHIALNGISPESTVNGPVDSILLEWIEVIPVTKGAKRTFDILNYKPIN